MQAFDFTVLKENHHCILQIGGSDQWANIVAGVELNRKFHYRNGTSTQSLYGLTCPLLVKADGEKMGKTAKGTLWVSREKTDSYDFYQAFINTFDEDVERLLSFFTRLEISDIQAMCKQDIVKAKQLMAFEVTKLVHGIQEAEKVRKTADDIFHGLGLSEHMPSFTVYDFSDIPVTHFLVDIGIASSRSEARRLIESNGILINQQRITNANQLITEELFVHHELIVQKGKKTFLKVKNSNTSV